MTSPKRDDFIADDSFQDALMARLLEEREILDELDRRCWNLIWQFVDGTKRNTLTIEDITVQRTTSMIVVVMVENYCVYSSSEAEDCLPDFDMIKTHVLPILRKHMVLDDLGRV